MPQLKPDHKSPTEGEEAEIQRQIAADQEDSAHGGHRNPARFAIEADPELVEWSRRTRGRQARDHYECASVRTARRRNCAGTSKTESRDGKRGSLTRCARRLLARKGYSSR